MTIPDPKCNRLRINDRDRTVEPPSDLASQSALRSEIEPWITSLVRSEHLSLLVGSGLTNAVLSLVGASPVDMAMVDFTGKYNEQLKERAAAVAKVSGRGNPNIEDEVRAALELIGGLRITDPDESEKWQSQVDEHLRSFAGRLLQAESNLLLKLNDEIGEGAMNVLAGFLGSFTSRAATRDRLHIFTTNYDRFVEFGLDHSGTWKLDRFLGSIRPTFRASRLDVDLHYSPPGIRGEPRYLEGVVRLTKLHGSVDWVAADDGAVARLPVEFGCPQERYRELIGSGRSLLIYPNSAKDVETSEYPYAELFRDFASAVVRPNSVLATYGYGFGDDHINRVIADMLTIPSTHLLVLARDDVDGRIGRFFERCGRPSQLSFLIGPHLADIESLVHFYLPKPSIDRITNREAELLQRRGFVKAKADEPSGEDFDGDDGVEPEASEYDRPEEE